MRNMKGNRGIKVGGHNVNNLRLACETVIFAERKKISNIYKTLLEKKAE